MPVRRKHLLSCDETGALRTLLLGVAAELDMEFCEAPFSLPGVRELIAKQIRGVLVVNSNEGGQAVRGFFSKVLRLSPARRHS